LFSKIILLFHTLKFLKLEQILWRVILYLPRVIRPKSNHPLPLNQIVNSIIFLKKRKCTTDFESFSFLNQTHNILEIGWNSTTISKLWLYNLHYCDCLQQPNYRHEADLATSFLIKWIKENPWGNGTGWEPYPTSLRIINWIKYHFCGFRLPEEAVLSLWNQTLWLENRPEYHLLGNHLFVNAKALFFATAFFRLNDSNRVYLTAISILEKELDEQFLADGSHFELSPMYHAIGMEDLIDILNIAPYLPASFPKMIIENKVKRGLQWLQGFIYDNGELAHFNDCANGIAPSYNELVSYASSIGIEVKSEFDDDTRDRKYENSGFVVHKDDNWHLIADLGKIGPDYLPGHAHADTLSFELAAKGKRVVVNSGTSIYGTSKERIRQRSTAAHSTVEINSRSSSEVWSGFRVARRAEIFDIQYKVERVGVFFGASHDGYLKQGIQVTHRRLWKFDRTKWEIIDTVSGTDCHPIARFYIHPLIQVVKEEDGYCFIHQNKEICRVWLNQVEHASLVNATYHDQFGVTKPNSCIEICFQAKEPLITKWEMA
jgi:uncharacterized heparinase superfamily protein